MADELLMFGKGREWRSVWPGCGEGRIRAGEKGGRGGPGIAGECSRWRRSITTSQGRHPSNKALRKSKGGDVKRAGASARTSEHDRTSTPARHFIIA